MKSLGGTFKIVCLVHFAFLSLGMTDACGQWVEQTLILDPGWNSVYFEVQPEPRECEFVFQDLPIVSVWCWNPKSSTAQYISTPPSPESLQVGHPRWLVYFPPSQPEHIATNLFKVIGGKAYLIKLDGAEQVQLTIRGEPRLPSIDWQANTHFLSGYHVSDGAGAPTFGDFFYPSLGHAGRAVYRLLGSQWQEVDIDNPAENVMRRGEAYWTSSEFSSAYTGPMEVKPDLSDDLVYDKILVEQGLTIFNLSDANVTVDVRLRSSLPPPEGAYEPVAGDVPLLYRAGPPDSNSPWEVLPETLSIQVDGESEKKLRLAVARSSMPGSGLYQSVLEVNNNQGMTIRVPVSAEFTDLTGLWVGYAAIDNVSQASDPRNPDVLKPTSGEFQFPLILHRDSEGNVYLLREVVQLWRPGIYDLDPITGMDFVSEPGRFVLVTDENLFSDPDYRGASLRDGQPRGRRISSAAFSFPEPVRMLSMSGSFGFDGAVYQLASPLVIAAGDALNPFIHMHHPDHDEADESFEVRRQITLEFNSSMPEASLVAGWGDTDIGGIYTEVLSGLHKRNIRAEGNFRLHRISRIGVLNDGR